MVCTLKFPNTCSYTYSGVLVNILDNRFTEKIKTLNCSLPISMVQILLLKPNYQNDDTEYRAGKRSMVAYHYTVFFPCRFNNISNLKNKENSKKL